MDEAGCHRLAYQGCCRSRVEQDPSERRAPRILENLAYKTSLLACISRNWAITWEAACACQSYCAMASMAA